MDMWKTAVLIFVRKPNLALLLHCSAPLELLLILLQFAGTDKNSREKWMQFWRNTYLQYSIQYKLTYNLGIAGTVCKT